MRIFYYSQSSGTLSYIPLIPLVSAYFFYRYRKQIWKNIHYSVWPGVAIIIGGLLLLTVWALVQRYIDPVSAISIKTGSFLAILSGSFILCFGMTSFRIAIFPIFFLYFIIPIPPLVERAIAEIFRFGSEKMVSFYFFIAGIPYIREGNIFHLDNFSFNIAQQCSGINSGLSLFFISMIMAKLFLKNPWVRLCFIITVIPIGWIKNGMRIAVLTLLGNYVNPDFLYGPLHRQGGKPFFIIALLFLGLSLGLFKIIEKKWGTNWRIKRKKTILNEHND